MIFMDFEASALKGFPIEIGWAIVHPDRRITVESHFIHCERWMDRVELWDVDTETIHHIRRQLLIEMGEPPAEVARRTNEALAGTVVCIDSPYDRVWATQLFSEAGVGQRFAFADVATAFAGDEVDERAFEFARQIIDIDHPRTHRAANDARHWAELYRMSLRDDAIPRSLNGNSSVAVTSR